MTSVALSFFNVNAESYLKTPNGQKDANFKARYEGAGIAGVLSKRQQNLKNSMDRSFNQLYGMEAALIPTKNTTKEVLEGYYLELQKNLSKTDVKNKYTDTIANNILVRLYARVQQLKPGKIGETAFRQCFKDGGLDTGCIATFQKAHGPLPPGSSMNKAAMEIIYETHNLSSEMEPPPPGEETGQGVVP